MTAIASDRNVLSTAKGGIFLAGGSFFEFASRLVIAFLLARTLGVKDYGLYVLSISVAGIYTGISLLPTVLNWCHADALSARVSGV